MKYRIQSRKLGKTVEFFTGNGTRYVFVNLNGKPGTLGKQICQKGKLTGSTISCHDEKQFEIICKRWWKAYIKNYID